jgi:hypothetical protein
MSRQPHSLNGRGSMGIYLNYSWKTECSEAKLVELYIHLCLYVSEGQFKKRVLNRYYKPLATLVDSPHELWRSDQRHAARRRKRPRGNPRRIRPRMMRHNRREAAQFLLF